MTHVVLLRGGGDLASGVTLRLHRAGLRVLITELAQPLAVRRTVSFAEAIYQGEITVEGITARRATDPDHALQILQSNEIPVLVDPTAEILLQPSDVPIGATFNPHPSTFNPHPSTFNPHPSSFILHTLVDARLTKHPHDADIHAAPLVIGLGPGFIPSQNCHAAVETQRGHTLGRVYWDRPPESDTGLPEGDPARVLRAPTDGVLQNHAEIGERLKAGQRIAEVEGEPNETVWVYPHTSSTVTAPFAGVLRGLLYPGLHVTRGMKIGDVDPRNDPRYCYLISDKALAIGGGVLEAMLTWSEVRKQLW